MKKNKLLSKLRYAGKKDILVDKEIKTKLLRFQYKKNHWIAIILGQSSNAIIVYIPIGVSRFSVDGHNYFNTYKGKYINNKMILAVYFEGVILPVSHSCLQYEEIYTLFIDENGKPVKKDDFENIENKDRKLVLRNDDGSLLTTKENYLVVDKMNQIKGLEFDSKTMDILLESNLTEKMAHDRNEKILPILTIGVILLIILQLVNLGLTYLVR